MRTKKDLNRDILDITMTIAEMFPELSKYLGEMPVTISNPPDREIAMNTLKEYYDSLYSFLKNYSTYHGGIQKAKISSPHLNIWQFN